LFWGLDYQPDRWDDRSSLGHGDFRQNERFGAEVKWNTNFASPLVCQLATEVREEGQGGLRRQYSGKIVFRPNDRFTVRVKTSYTDRDAWLIHRSGRDFMSYESEEWRPRVSVDTFISARQELRVAMQWIGIKAVEDKRLRVPEGDGSLVPVGGDADMPGQLAISDLTFQARYRWEMAPLSTLYLVYNRGGRLSDTGIRARFGDMLKQAFSSPRAEFFVLKLRYRFGPA